MKISHACVQDLERQQSTALSERQHSSALSEDLSTENQHMAAANRQLQQHVETLQTQLQRTLSLQSEVTTLKQSSSQLQMQNTELQQQLQAAARAWADKHRQHKENMTKLQVPSLLKSSHVGHHCRTHSDVDCRGDLHLFCAAGSMR